MDWKKSKLVGKIVDILDENGKATGNWGTVIGYDGDCYHVAFANDMNCIPIFSRDEIRVCRDQERRKQLVGGCDGLTFF